MVFWQTQTHMRKCYFLRKQLLCKWKLVFDKLWLVWPIIIRITSYKWHSQETKLIFFGKHDIDFVLILEVGRIRIYSLLAIYDKNSIIKWMIENLFYGIFRVDVWHKPKACFWKDLQFQSYSWKCNYRIHDSARITEKKNNLPMQSVFVCFVFLFQLILISHQYKYGFSRSMFTELMGSSRNHVVNVKPFSYGHFASGGNTIPCKDEKYIEMDGKKCYVFCVRVQFFPSFELVIASQYRYFDIDNHDRKIDWVSKLTSCWNQLTVCCTLLKSYLWTGSYKMFGPGMRVHNGKLDFGVDVNYYNWSLFHAFGVRCDILTSLIFNILIAFGHKK